MSYRENARSPAALLQTMNTETDRVAVGYIVKPKGVRGEVVVEPLTDDIGRFDDLTEVTLEKTGEVTRQLRISAWRPEKPGIVVKFEGIHSPEDAALKIAKGYITIPHSEVPEPPDGMFYVFDLVGCVVEDENGADIGHVADVQEMPSADLLVVRNGEREILIPLVAEFIADVRLIEERVVVGGIDELVKSGRGLK